MIVQSNDIKILLNKATELVNEAKFDQALTYYYPITSLHKELQTSLDSKYQSMYNNFTACILLHISIEEAIILAKNNKLEPLKERLDFIYYKKNILLSKIDSEKLYNHVNDHYHYILGFYMYLFYKSKFLSEFENIYYYVNAGWYEKALSNYNILLVKYCNKLVKYGNHSVRNTLFKHMTNLLREIKLTQLKSQAYSDPAHYTLSNVKRLKSKPAIETSKASINVPGTIEFNKNEFNKLHATIKDNNVEDAIQILRSI